MRPALIADGLRLTRASLARRARALGPPPFACVPTADLDGVARLIAAIESGSAPLLLHPRSTAAEREALVAHALAGLAGAPPPEPPIGYFATSGSTGRPKLVELPARSLRWQAETFARTFDFGPDDRWLLALPLAHVSGFSCLTRAWFTGAALVLPAPGDDGFAALADATFASAVPTQLHRWIARGAPPPGLRAVLVGGAAAPPPLIRAARARGWPVLLTYGLTEHGGQVATQHLGATEDDDVGPPLPGVTLHLGPVVGLDEFKRSSLIAIESPGLFTRYLGAPPREGPFSTKDLGALVDGRLVVHGRIDDVITSGGEKIAPLEVERAALSVPGVEAAVAVGVPDPMWGEVVGLAVAPAEVDLAALGARLAEGLAPFRRPRQLLALAGLPRLPSGKPDRRTIAAWLRSGGPV